MVIFPLISFLISGIFTGMLIYRYVQKHRVHELVWAISFGNFALASLCEVMGDVWGWSSVTARLYYLTGAMLVVGFLGLGNILLLNKGTLVKLSSVIMGISSLLSIYAVVTASIDANQLQTSGWQAIHKDSFLLILTIFLNSVGTIVVLGCALYSAWRLWRAQADRQKVFGLVWIAVGTCIVASGGTLTRFGHHEYLYIAMAPGVLLIFYGYLLTIRVINRVEAARMTTIPVQN